MTVECADATQPQAWWDGTPFGAIIVDPSCSSTGLLRTKPEVRFHVTPEDLDEHRSLQLRLLHAAWPLLRPGGELLYTTCSILSCENDEVVAEFLGATADAAAVALRPPWAMASVGGSPSGERGEHKGARRRRRRRILADVPGAAAATARGVAYSVTPDVHAWTRPHGGIVFYPSATHQGGFVALLRKSEG